MLEDNGTVIDIKRNERQSNIEVLRIIMMGLIIAHHYVVNSGMLDCLEYSNYDANMFFLHVFGMWGKTGINVFTIITGYFMVGRVVTKRHFIKIYFPFKFYCIIFFWIFFLSGYETFSIKLFLKAHLGELFLPGYSSTLLFFMLVMPFLNEFINVQNKKSMETIIAILFIYNTVLGTFGKQNTFNLLLMMIFMYMCGAYIKLYSSEWWDNKAVALGGTVISVILMIMSILVIDIYNVMTEDKIEWSYMFSDCNKILAVSTAIFTFLLFKNIEIPSNKVINQLSSTTFGILLIHGNGDTMIRFLWGDLIENKIWVESKYLWIHAIVTVIVIYIVCHIVDLFRQRYIDKYLFSPEKNWYRQPLWRVDRE